MLNDERIPNDQCQKGGAEESLNLEIGNSFVIRSFVHLSFTPLDKLMRSGMFTFIT